MKKAKINKLKLHCETAKAQAGIPAPTQEIPYVRPKLQKLGDIRSFVMSPSAGIFESGLGQGFKP